MEKGKIEVKIGLAEMLKGGVIMDVTNADQAKIALTNLLKGYKLTTTISISGMFNN